MFQLKTQNSKLKTRLLDTPPSPGAFNMGLDEALMESVRAGGAPVLRFYRWEPACVSFGRNQPARGRYDVAEIGRLGLDVVRRPTGGRAVVHARELTYSVVVDDRSLGGPRASYHLINRALVAGLRLLGVAAELSADTERSPVPSIHPCFEQAAAGEVVVGGRKLVGSAQWRQGGVLLQHGSLLLQDDQQILSCITRGEPALRAARSAAPAGTARGGAALESAPATLADHLIRQPAWTELTHALTAGWAEVMGAAPIASVLDAAELARARSLREKYQSLEWIWRR